MELGVEVTNPDVVGLGHFKKTALDSVFVNKQEETVAIISSDHALLLRLLGHSEKKRTKS